VNVEERNPIVVAFHFEDLLGNAKGLQCFIEVLHLHKRNTIKCSALRLFVVHSVLIELFGCAVRKGCSLVRQVELEIDVCFVQVAQRDVERAAGELLPYMRKAMQRLTIETS